LLHLKRPPISCHEFVDNEVRMKTIASEMQGNTGDHGGGVFVSGRTWALEPKKGDETPSVTEKN
jgi:hypothetical protein